MCASCGCGKPNEDHGDKSNITLADLEQAGKAAGVSASQVADNLKASC